MSASAKTSADEFLKDERPRSFEARIVFSGEVWVTIDAGSLEEAKAKAADMCEGLDELDVMPEDIEDARVSHVWKSPTMYLVTRDGKPMKVSHIEPGDQPRQPDDRGF